MNQNRNSVDRDDREAISNQQAQLLNHPKILEKFAAVLTNKQSKSSIKESNTIKNKDNQIKDLESVLAVYDNYKMYLLFGYPQELIIMIKRGKITSFSSKFGSTVTMN